MEIEGSIKNIIGKLKNLEEEHSLRIVTDNKISSTRGFVIEHCGQYLIVVKDSLSREALEDVLVHEGIHIDCDHLEGHSRTKAEADTKMAVREYHERR